ARLPAKASAGSKQRCLTQCNREQAHSYRPLIHQPPAGFITRLPHSPSRPLHSGFASKPAPTDSWRMLMARRHNLL
nr:hypothetical protein [Tanacetum cinerariifolium]